MDLDDFLHESLRDAHVLSLGLNLVVQNVVGEVTRAELCAALPYKDWTWTLRPLCLPDSLF